jgi:3-dehydroquinate synthase
MAKVRVNLDERSYDIIIDSNVRSKIGDYLAKIGDFSKVFVITDTNVAKLHLDEFSSFLDNADIKHKNIILEAGEQSKDFATLENISNQILSEKIDRNTLLIALGGGVIGDLTGFVASILLRGINFVQVPTTLLAAVDSSVGGKTAINSKFGKNLIGSFYQPKLVLCDLDFIKTLPDRDFISGYGEVIKYGLIEDEEFFSFLEDNIDKIKSKDSEILKKLIVKSCETKASIVSQDETEQGKRALLNFGHTFGHIFETQSGYSNELLHGEAVAIGMNMAAIMSQKLGLIDESQTKRIEKHLKQAGLFSSPKEIRDSWDKASLLEHLYKDKKVKNSQLTFILLNNIGSAFIQNNVSKELFLETLSEFL